ncbi:SGNH/GDSL hydrolase family protein [Kitasatospora sp. NPDC004799]|uniref:SGNH/GDSL hydrolase family protein n=1 Tax=Kitasatospora sp. NPDC004799 TaxID=3154460 RepID=UPI0033B656C6
MPRSRVPALAAALLALTATTVAGTSVGTGYAADVHYVALGDSYSAGGGSSTEYLNSCHQTTKSYPYLYAQATSPASFAFQACGGADTADVLNGQLGPLDAGTTLVSVTIGGNDVDLSGVMSSCLFGTEAACLDAVASAEAAAGAELPGRLGTLYTAIRARATGAKVVVLGYPKFFDLDKPLCPGMGATRRAALNHGAEVLDETIRAAVAKHPGFVYQDVTDRFAGHRLCDAEPWLHALNWPIGQSFHPTAAGQAGAYLPALRAGV